MRLDIYAPEAAGNDAKELCDDPEVTEADVESTADVLLQPRHDLNACFVKEVQIENYPDEKSEDTNDNRVEAFHQDYRRLPSQKLREYHQLSQQLETYHRASRQARFRLQPS